MTVSGNESKVDNLNDLITVDDDTVIEIRRFGDLKEGDVILSPTGEHVTVTRAYDEHLPESMYEVELWDGSKVSASGNHLWYVETGIDLSYHQSRKKKAKKVLSTLSHEHLSDFVELATNSDVKGSEYEEIALNEILELTGQADNVDMVDVFSRIAASIGHIVEETVQNVDFGNGEEVSSSMIPLYDTVSFCRQVLTLTGSKRYTRLWSPIVGRVVTTEEMMELALTDTVNLPDAPRNRTLTD